MNLDEALTIRQGAELWFDLPSIEIVIVYLALIVAIEFKDDFSFVLYIMNFGFSSNRAVVTILEPSFNGDYVNVT